MRADRRSQAQRTHRLDTAYDAVLFDLDGVVTNTAAIHAAAWKQLFDEVLRDSRVHVDDPQNTFDPVADYRRYVDGRSREDGVARYLAARGVRLDAEAIRRPTVGMDDRRDRRAQERTLPCRAAHARTAGLSGAAALLRRLRDAAVPAGLVTASRNAQQLLNTSWSYRRLRHGRGRPNRARSRITCRASLTPTCSPRQHAASAFLPLALRSSRNSVAGVKPANAAVSGSSSESTAPNSASNSKPRAPTSCSTMSASVILGLSTTDPWRLVYEGFDPAHEGHRGDTHRAGQRLSGDAGVRPEHHDDGIHYPGHLPRWRLQPTDEHYPRPRCRRRTPRQHRTGFRWTSNRKRTMAFLRTGADAQRTTRARPPTRARHTPRRPCRPGRASALPRAEVLHLHGRPSPGRPGDHDQCTRAGTARSRCEQESTRGYATPTWPPISVRTPHTSPRRRSATPTTSPCARHTPGRAGSVSSPPSARV